MGFGTVLLILWAVLTMKHLLLYASIIYGQISSHILSFLPRYFALPTDHMQTHLQCNAAPADQLKEISHNSLGQDLKQNMYL